MKAAGELTVSPPPIVKTLILLRVAMLEIDAIRREVLILPPREQVPFRAVLASLERRAQQLEVAARRILISH